MHHKLKLESISGNSEFAAHGQDVVADRTLYLMGFRTMEQVGAMAKASPEAETKWQFRYGLYIAAYPVKKDAYFVYYDGPMGNVELESRVRGSFRLVRVRGSSEIELDQGSMSLGHYNEGICPTYYARGLMLESYSFHFRFSKAEAAKHAEEAEAFKAGKEARQALARS